MFTFTLLCNYTILHLSVYLVCVHVPCSHLFISQSYFYIYLSLLHFFFPIISFSFRQTMIYLESMFFLNKFKCNRICNNISREIGQIGHDSFRKLCRRVCECGRVNTNCHFWVTRSWMKPKGRIKNNCGNRIEPINWICIYANRLQLNHLNQTTGHYPLHHSDQQWVKEKERKECTLHNRTDFFFNVLCINSLVLSALRSRLEMEKKKKKQQQGQ